MKNRDKMRGKRAVTQESSGGTSKVPVQRAKGGAVCTEQRVLCELDSSVCRESRFGLRAEAQVWGSGEE